MQDLQTGYILSNFFKFQATKTFYKYKCTITPLDKQDDASSLFIKLIKQREIQKQLRQYFGPHLALNLIIYTTEFDKEDSEFDGKLAEEEQFVQLFIEVIVSEDNQGELFGFYGRMLKEMQRQLRMMRISGKYFFKTASVDLPNHFMKIYPGYQSSLRTFGTNSNIFANIDPVFKICNTKNLNEFIINNMRQLGQEKLIHYLEGQVFSYAPRRMWKIDTVCFNQNPQSSFQRKDESITYIEYYKKFHNIVIQNFEQPLIQNKDRKTGKVIYLIPELLQLTGLDEKTRSNFQITREIDKHTKPNPIQRYEKTRDLIKQINKCENSSNEQQKQIIEQETFDQQLRKEYQQKYLQFLKGVQIKEEPETFTGNLLNGGSFILGNEQAVSTRDNLDRNINQAYKLFSENLIQAAKTYCVQLATPQVRFLKTNNIQQWNNAIKEFEGKNVIIMVLILQGEKKQAPLYSGLKHTLICESGLPSQIVLQKTLMGKGVRSICNKILIQMVAKTGGLPWVIGQMPFRDVPTMVVGIDVYHRMFAGVRKSIYAFVATMDFRFALYFSVVKVQEPGQEIGTFVEDCAKQAILKFKQLNKQYHPARIFVYRDGVSEGQRTAVKALEISAIRRAATSMGCDNMKLVFILVDKKANSKFYDASSSSLQNCQPGSVIDSPEICKQEEFYMITAKVNVGIAQPVHYFIIEDDIILTKETDEEKAQYKQSIEVFTFKLCHLYYNWTGSIKVPAPCIYAHKLSNLVGDKWGDASQFSVSQSLQDRCSLYYI